MERKVNNAKLDIIKFLRKSAESQGQNQPKLCLQWKFNQYTLTRVFLHAAFISAMKIVQNPTVFMKNAKIIGNHSFLLIV